MAAQSVSGLVKLSFCGGRPRLLGIGVVLAVFAVIDARRAGWAFSIALETQR